MAEQSVSPRLTIKVGTPRGNERAVQAIKVILPVLEFSPELRVIIRTISGARYLIRHTPSGYYLGRKDGSEPVGNVTDWNRLYPDRIKPDPKGGIDFGTWKCTNVWVVDLWETKEDRLSSREGYLYTLYSSTAR